MPLDDPRLELVAPAESLGGEVAIVDETKGLAPEEGGSENTVVDDTGEHSSEEGKGSNTVAL